MTFVVAEVGVNWDGDFKLAEQMMINAKKAGCNAVKFQAFDEKIVSGHPEKTRLLNSSISKENIKKIDQIASQVGIEWFCTPMFLSAVDFLDPYVKRFKIRVADGKPLLENQTSELIEKILSTGKEVFVSCQTSPKETQYYKNPKIKWLYCVSKYPCEFSDLDFRVLKDYQGYSNHCPHFLAPLTAVILGAGIIEVHITSDKTKPFADNNVSFNYVELKELVEAIRIVEIIKK